MCVWGVLSYVEYRSDLSLPSTFYMPVRLTRLLARPIRVTLSGHRL